MRGGSEGAKASAGAIILQPRSMSLSLCCSRARTPPPLPPTPAAWKLTCSFPAVPVKTPLYVSSYVSLYVFLHTSVCPRLPATWSCPATRI